MPHTPAPASIEKEPRKGWTQLMIAAAAGAGGAVKRRLKSHPHEINAKSSWEHTPLMAAAYGGHLAVVELLIANKAKVNVANHLGTTALMFAAGCGHAPVVALLIANRARVNVADVDGMTALMHAAAHGHTAVAALLIAKNAEIDVADRSGDTALMYAALFGHLPVVELLIANKAKTNVTNTEGCTPLMYAAESGHSAVVQLLIANKAKVNVANHLGTTALMFAAGCGHAPVVAQLIANNAKVDLVNAEGWTALMVAAENGRAEAAKDENASAVIILLTEGRAIVTQKNNDGETALDIAKLYEYRHPGIVEILQQWEYNGALPPSMIADPPSRMLDDLKTAVKAARLNEAAKAAARLKEAATTARVELAVARLSAAYEVLVRQGDLSNPRLASDERLRRAERLVKTYKRLRRLKPDFHDDSAQLILARSITNKRQYQRQLEKKKTLLRASAAKLAM